MTTTTTTSTEMGERFAGTTCTYHKTHLHTYLKQIDDFLSVVRKAPRIHEGCCTSAKSLLAAANGVFLALVAILGSAPASNNTLVIETLVQRKQERQLV